MAVMMQAFYWDAPKLEKKEGQWWTLLAEKVEDLGKAGITVTRESPLLPDFAASSRLYMRLLMSFLAASFQPEVYAGAQAAACRAARRRSCSRPRP